MRRIETLASAGLLVAVVGGLPAVPRAGGVPGGTAPPVSVEGCLRAGSADGEFIVTAGGERHTAMAGAGVRLDDHVNHQVRLTGELAQREIGPVFVVSGVRTLAPSCAPRR